MTRYKVTFEVEADTIVEITAAIRQLPITSLDIRPATSYTNTGPTKRLAEFDNNTKENN